jgi:hypothetical protein
MVMISPVRFSAKTPSPFEQELAKVVITPEIEKQLETLAQNKGLNTLYVKNIYKQERAFLNLTSKNQKTPPISDEKLLQEFEKRKWDEKIGPRN